MPNVGEVFVQPAAGDAGTALGAATLAATQLGDQVQPMESAYLGPRYTNDEVASVLRQRDVRYEKCDSITDTAAALLAGGPAVAQLALPVGPAQQTDSSFGVVTAGPAQVPPTAIAPFEPVNLDPDPPQSSQAETADQAKVEGTRRSQRIGSMRS